MPAGMLTGGCVVAGEGSAIEAGLVPAGGASLSAGYDEAGSVVLDGIGVTVTTGMMTLRNLALDEGRGVEKHTVDKLELLGEVVACSMEIVTLLR